MKGDPEVIKRVVASYKLMLDFYGMQLLSEESGLVGRSSPPRNFGTRYRNLVSKCRQDMRAATSYLKPGSL